MFYPMNERGRRPRYSRQEPALHFQKEHFHTAKELGSLKTLAGHACTDFIDRYFDRADVVAGDIVDPDAQEVIAFHGTAISCRTARRLAASCDSARRSGSSPPWRSAS